MSAICDIVHSVPSIEGRELFLTIYAEFRMGIFIYQTLTSFVIGQLYYEQRILPGGSERVIFLPWVKRMEISTMLESVNNFDSTDWDSQPAADSGAPRLGRF